MIVTVSTIKDKLVNVQRFVEGNLAGGADHMLIFLDAPEPEVQAWLATRPEVTTILTDQSWWNGQRPRLLNKRQWINANLGKALLSLTDWTDWVFHIDADEIVQIDREALARVPAEEVGVRLKPLEVVSQMHWDGEPQWFKPLLEEPDLMLLHSLGLLREPTNVLHFRSHTIGKVGVRPLLDLWIGIHKAVDMDNERIRLHRNPGLRLLHYESYSGEEFVRKWTNMVGSGPSVHFGPERQKLADGLKALLEKDLAPEVMSRHLSEIYRRHMEDPFEALRDLELVEHIDPRAGGHQPELLTAAQREQLAGWIEGIRPLSKRQFQPGSSLEEIEQTMTTVAGRPITRRQAPTKPPAPGRFAGKVKGARARAKRHAAKLVTKR